MKPQSVEGVTERGFIQLEGKPDTTKRNKKRRTVRSADVAAFSHNLSRMLQAGLPVIQALQRLQAHIRNQKMRSVVSSVQQSIQAGQSLTEALSQHQDTFDDFYVHIIRLGEETGQLDLVLQRLTSLYEWKENIQKRLVGLLVYPVFVVLSFGLVCAVYLGLILPMILSAVGQSGLSMPVGIQLMVFFKNYWLLMLMGIGFLCTCGITWLGTTNVGQRVQDECLLSIPYIRGLVKSVEACNFLFGIHLAYEAGLSMDLAYELSSQCIGNSYLREVFEGVGTPIRNGASLDRVLADTDCLPELVLENIAIGEESGQLGKMLQGSLTKMTTQVNQSIDLLLQLIKPAAIVILAILFGCMLIVFYNLIFQVLGARLANVIKP